VTIRLEGVFACDVNLVLILMMCLAGEKFVLLLCLPLSEVKLWFAFSEVQYCLFRRLFCAFENTGQSLQIDCLFVADLTKRARQLWM
jgi:hypothetical protein